MFFGFSAAVASFGFEVLSECPFADVDREHLHVGFFRVSEVSSVELSVLSVSFWSRLARDAKVGWSLHLMRLIEAFFGVLISLR